jgi:hypothetical protein
MMRFRSPKTPRYASVRGYDDSSCVLDVNIFDILAVHHILTGGSFKVAQTLLIQANEVLP